MSEHKIDRDAMQKALSWGGDHKKETRCYAMEPDHDEQLDWLANHYGIQDGAVKGRRSAVLRYLLEKAWNETE